MHHGRVTVLATFVALGFLSVTIRLIDLMVFERGRLTEKASQQHMKLETVDAKRGTIYDARMRELVVDKTVDSVYADPRKISDPEEVARILAPVLKTDPALLRQRLSEDKGFVWLARRVDEDTAARVKTLGLKAVDLIPETRRTYPKETLGAHVLGFVNIDNQGVEGLERTFDPVLRGIDGRSLNDRDALGKSLPSGDVRPVDGNSLVLTLDEDLQYITEKAVADAMDKWKARSAVAVVMEPSTGRILAMAVNPVFAPGRPSTADARRNRAVTDVYEPGSTFKTMLAAAALEEGRIRPQDRIDCSSGGITIGGHRISDVHRHGVLSFAEVLQKSSNVGMIKVGQRVGGETYYKYLKAFGFGEKTGVGLSGEVGGICRKPKPGSLSSLASMSMGYEVMVTPLQMLRAYSAIANGGMLMKPRIVSEVISPEGQVVTSFPPEPVRQVISQKTSRVLTEILETVVQEGGTAVTANVLGNSVAGKTGTSKKLDPKTGRYSNRYFSSFVGFVPSQNPRLAAIVLVEEPRGAIYGGVVAAPVFRTIAERALIYLNVPRENTGNVVLVSG